MEDQNEAQAAPAPAPGEAMIPSATPGDTQAAPQVSQVPPAPAPAPAPAPETPQEKQAREKAAEEARLKAQEQYDPKVHPLSTMGTSAPESVASLFKWAQTEIQKLHDRVSLVESAVTKTE